MAALVTAMRDRPRQSCQLPHQGFEINPVASETPAQNRGSFFNGSQGGEIIGGYPFPIETKNLCNSDAAVYPESMSVPSGDTMGKKAKALLRPELPIEFDKSRQYPVDSITGLPYPLLIINGPNEVSSSENDYHHLLFPRLELLDSGDIADEALRICYGQDIPIWLHQVKHDRFVGTMLPKNPLEKFTTVALACARVIPLRAMYLGNERSLLVTPSRPQRLGIESSIHHEYKDKKGKPTGEVNAKKLGRYFAKTALEQTLSGVEDDSSFDRFLHPRTRREKNEAGALILSTAVYAATKHAQERYDQAFHAGYVNHVAPRQVAKVVKNYIRPVAGGYFYGPLEELLSA